MVAPREELETRRKIWRKRRWIIALSIIGVFCLVVSMMSLVQCTDLIVSVSEGAQSSPQNGDWAMFRRDLLHSGSTGDNITLPQGNLKWTFSAGDAIHSSPAICDGKVYVGSRDGYIYALDAATGEKIWAFHTDSWVESSPAVVGGVVYCGSNDGNLYALNAETGEKIWSYETPLAVQSSPAVADGVVYVGCDDFSLYAIDAATGSELWRSYTGNFLSASPAVSKGIVVVGSADNIFYSFNAKNGSARLEFAANVPVYSSAAIKEGVAYFMDNFGVFIAMDIMARNWWLENRIREYWNALYGYGVAPRPTPNSGFLWGVALGFNVRSVSSPSIAGDYAYVGSGKNLYSVDLINHTVQWTFATNGDVVSSPAVAGGVVYVGSEDGHLYAVDRATGTLLWDYTTRGVVSSSPAVANGLLYVGSMDGNLYCFE
jgi:outer membrane protein assembly factor BamB